MKLVSCYTIGLCVAGGLLTLPSVAQDAITLAPDIRVETRTLQIPEVTVQTDVDVAPLIELAQQRAKTATKNLLKFTQDENNVLQEYTTAQAFQNLTTTVTPEMAKKTREIALLRQMLNLKLSASDIEKALPLLRELKDADKAAPVKPDQVLNDEYDRLLRAKPGDPMPPSSGDALRDAANNYRSRKQAIWDKMGQAIGREKARGIRSMLRSESVFSFPAGSSWNNFFTTPRAMVAPLAPQYKIRPTRPQTPAPEAGPDAPPVPDAPVTARPAEPPRLPRRPADAAPAPAPPDTDTPTAETPAPGTRERDAARAAGRARRATPAPPASVYVGPGARALTLDSNGGRTRIYYSFYGQATLDELIDLFERKLAAMRR